MKKRGKILIIITILFLLALTAFLLLNYYFNKRENKRNVAIENNTITQNINNYKTIGLIAGNMQDKSIANIFSILKDYAKENENIKMLLFDSEGKTDKQMLQLEEYIGMKVDGIIMNPVGKSFPKSVLDKLKESSIPAILVNSDYTDDYFPCAVDSSSAKIGETQAEFIAGKLNGKGNILVFTGLPDNNSSIERLSGFKKTIGKYPGINATEINDDLWNMDKSGELLYNTLKKYKNIDGIVLQQNDLSIQIQPVLEKMDIEPLIIGVDAAPEVLELLKEGKLDASAYIRSSDMAVGAYDTMMRIIKKEKVSKIRIIPHKLITSENIDEFIENNLNYKIK